ncbi:hypothetical protein [Rossellomorea marisflavi]|uniref:hypothetical protein n=1 Tax=Rossellomorea marisflavi TaxID=189381 RepID=UPI00345AFFCF
MERKEVRKAEAARSGATSIRRDRQKGMVLALLAITTYDLEPQGAVAGQKEKRRRLALGRQA